MNITKKHIITGIVTGALVLSLAVPVFAQSATTSSKIKQPRRNLLQAIKNIFGHVTKAKVTAINGASFTISANGKTVTVNTNSNTKFRRHYWGDSSISEMSVNDTVNVWGDWADSSQTTMTARLVRDLSIMKRFGVFFGTVQSVSSNGFVMVTVNRGNQTITVASTTKYLSRKGQIISQSDVVTGNKVRVKGMWDKTNGTITEVSEVKDFSLPAATSASPTAVPTTAQ